MRCVSSPDGDPVSFARAVADHGRGIRHSRIQRAKGVNAEPINIVTKNDLIIRLIETRISRRPGGQIINRLII
jgi:hypothetical protein